jgi:DNA-directed RNA polymerase subunit beta
MPSAAARLTQQDRYKLKKYWRTNQDTAINQRPLVHRARRSKAGEVLADGAATELGQLALGSPTCGGVHALVRPQLRGRHRALRAPGEGRRLFVDPHPGTRAARPRHEAWAGRDHARNPERLEESLVDLDERGIVRIGAHVKPGDILVGKITPKGETELSPEEKLLTAIFGEKAKDVKDSSLKVSPGMEGRGHRREDLLARRGSGGREGPRRADRRSAPSRGRGEGARQRRAR